MIFEINNNGVWYDIAPYLAYNGLEGTRNDVDGPNAGRGLDGTMIRDRVATKMKWTFNTPPMVGSNCDYVEELLMPESFMVRTDYFGSLRQYHCYSNNVQRVHVIQKNGIDWYKLSFPIVEM